MSSLTISRSGTDGETSNDYALREMTQRLHLFEVPPVFTFRVVRHCAGLVGPDLQELYAVRTYQAVAVLVVGGNNLRLTRLKPNTIHIECALDDEVHRI